MPDDAKTLPVTPKASGPAVPPKPGTPDPKPDPLIGTKIAHYRIESVLGQGGMGKVYKAFDTSLAKPCAIKILPQEFARQDRTYIDRFVREARSAAAVEHPNVLPVHFVGKVEDNYFIEMQYVDGGTLQGLLKEKGRLEVKEAARIIRDVAAGLQAAHEKGIIHRDIKPTNVMLTSKGHVYVMDFGLAKLVQAHTALTQQGFILGTPLYMAPEQATGEAVDHRSDIYSLGVVFYQLLTGNPPYTADSPMGLFYKHQHAPIPDIAQTMPEVPAHIADVVRKMMAKRPADRYQSCAEIVQELSGFLATGGPTLMVSEETLKDAPDHRQSVLKRAKRGAPSRVAAKPAARRGLAEGGPAEGASPKKRPAMPIVLALVLLLVLVLGAVVYFILKKKGSGFGVQVSGTATTAVGAQHAAPLPTPAQPAKSPWDDVYIATAATGDKIPHPLSRKTYKQTLADGTTIDVPEGMVYVPAGEFTMGEKESVHQVYLDAYFIGKYEVTNAEWEVFCNFTGFTPLPCYWKDGKIPEGRENHPVVLVSWDDARRYCEWVSAQTGRKVSLPTEAQWEKAAGWDPKNGTKRWFPWGNQWDPKLCNSHCSLTELGLHPNDKGEDSPEEWNAWTHSEKGLEILASGGNLRPVGTFPMGKSAYGCFDMAGNAYEWCADWYMKEYYRLNGARRNPEGPTEEMADERDWGGKKSKGRVLRGGTWHTSVSYCRTVSRDWDNPSDRVSISGVGLRVVVAAPLPAMGPGLALGEKGAGMESPSSPAPRPSSRSYDDVYVTTAATGEKIPHPLSRKTRSEVLPNGQAVDVPEGMAYVPAGEFTMGVRDRPMDGAHPVYLDAYFISKYEVTNAEWKVFCDSTGFAPRPAHWRGGEIPEGKENHPVVWVNWDDAQRYCEWMTRLRQGFGGQGTGTTWQTRLPTEAEWEKAARGPEGYIYPWGNDWNPENCNSGYLCASRYGLTANRDGNVPGWGDFMKSEKGKELDAAGGAMPVGSFPKGRSSYGCYDMAGNAGELCVDWFRADYYKRKDAQHNPQGPNKEEANGLRNIGGMQVADRVFRGGAWNDFSGLCRSVSRNRHGSNCRHSYFGFRVVVVPAR